MNNLRKALYVENIPTYKIRAVPLGSLVEVKGKAFSSKLQKTIDGKEVVFYSYLVYIKQGDRLKVVDGECLTPYFYIKDETGYLLIEAMPAEKNINNEFKEISSIPPQIQEILVKNGYGEFVENNGKRFFKPKFSGKVYVEQRFIYPEEELYVLGRVSIKKINGKDMPVMVKDEVYDIFLLSNSKEYSLSTEFKIAGWLHLFAACIGFIWWG